ncbi:T9SS type A sorting domain-containing protein [Flavobacterium sp.]|uniref:T9SS type A sorting domain-containing protein n=1 Tax=Flavobacterium sp. TaxID=239 RepID=UPI0026096F27|nr:T9SS type A sorting domain-containing protein [Flavobacterium sp.]
MKKITLLFLFIFIINKSYSQVTYFNYLDYTSEWRSYGAGWSGFYMYDSYQTRYFDGDETINGIVYYKEYSIAVNTDYYYGGPVSTTYVGGPYYVREDFSGKFYRINPNDGTETLILDNQIIANSQLGDPFPYPGATCNVQIIENVSLGATTLKKVKGINPGNDTGTLEGVGFIGLACARGIEGGGGLNCYSKQGITLQFGTINCASFPTPIRTSLSTNNNNLSVNQIIVYPNPTNGKLKIKHNLQEGVDYEITNIQGTILGKGNLENEEQPIDISNFSSGVYIIRIGNGDSSIYRKIVKE